MNFRGNLFEILFLSVRPSVILSTLVHSFPESFGAFQNILYKYLRHTLKGFVMKMHLHFMRCNVQKRLVNIFLFRLYYFVIFIGYKV